MKTDALYAMSDRYFACTHYGKYQSDDGKQLDARIRLERIDNPTNNSFKLRMSRINAQWTSALCRIQDKEMNLGANFQVESQAFMSYQNFIYICGNPETGELLFRDTVPPDNLMLLAVYTRGMLIDRDNVFCTTIPKANMMNQRFDVTLFGVTPLQEGEAEYDMTSMLNEAFNAAGALGLPEIILPPGIYTLGNTRESLSFSKDLIYKGVGKVIIRPMKNPDGSYMNIFISEGFLSGAIENMVFEQCYFATTVKQAWPKTARYENIVINHPTLAHGALYMFNFSSPQPVHCIFRNVKITVGFVYAVIDGANNIHITVENCEFNGAMQYPLRLQAPLDALIRNNVINNNNATTGIFIKNSTTHIARNLLIENNIVSGCLEESISLDGIGDNPDTQPVIAQGNIKEAYNDAEGYLCLVLEHVYHPSNPDVNVLDINPKNYIFVFVKETGIDGEYYEMVDISLQNNKKVVRLNALFSSSKVNVGLNTIVTFSSGFLNCSILNNTIYGANDFGDLSHGTAISLWLNVFGINVSGNRVYGCNRGLSYFGGSLMANILTMAVNVNITGNSFFGIRSKALEIENGYGSVTNRQNIISGNSIISSGYISLKGQQDLLFSNNVIRDTDLVMDEVDNSFVTANYFQGGNVIKASLGSNCIISDNVGIQ